MVTKSEESLLKLALTFPLGAEVKYVARKIAELHPDGVFDFKLSRVDRGYTELTFKYQASYRNRGDTTDKVASITFVIDVEHSKKVGTNTKILSFEYRRIKLEGGRAHTRSEPYAHGRLRAWMVKNGNQSFYQVDDLEDCIELMLQTFERSLITEAKAADRVAVRRKAAAEVKAEKDATALGELKKELFDEFKLHGNKHADKLFAYTLTQQVKPKKIDAQFRELVHIIQ
jgi:hypothetical protein